MKTQAYRPEIDGLRAIAVLAVVAYHVAPTAISGGFVGVDVFFVISGYLISGILLREIEQGHFQLRHFYARRVLRIFPALATVLSAVLVYAWFASSPRELSALGAHAAAGAAFVANIFYWRESGYFDSAAELKPLLHLWSLGIEEQFYIVWPLVLIIAARCRLRVTPVLLLLGIASFALNLFQAHHAPSAAFFLPGARVWELLIGAALAEAERSGRSIGHRALANAAALIGLMMIAFAVVHVNRAMSFPGWWAVFPTVGAALVIAAGAQSSVNRVVLASRPMIFVGLISYPLYLWHWPLLAFLKLHASGNSKFSLRLVAGVLAVGLAWATYRWIEKPLRTHAQSRWLIWALTFCVACAGLAGALLFFLKGAPGRFFADPVDRQIFSEIYDTTLPYRRHVCFLDTITEGPADLKSECTPCDNSKHRKIVLWGDSHAAHLYPGLKKIADERGYCVEQITSTSCPPLVEADVANNGSCPEMNAFALRRIADTKPELVVLGSRWSRDDQGLESKIRATAKALQARGVGRTILFGPPPSWEPTLETVLFREFRKTGSLLWQLTPAAKSLGEIRKMDVRLQKACRDVGFTYFSALNAFCEGDSCRVRLAPGLDGLVTPDYDHYTQKASEFVLEKATTDASFFP